jgi:hypothetical protein
VADAVSRAARSRRTRGDIGAGRGAGRGRRSLYGRLCSKQCRAVLTARHCFEQSSAALRASREFVAAASAGYRIVLGSPDDATAVSGTIDDVWLHPTLDVALLEAGWLVDHRTMLVPLSPNRGGVGSEWIGRPVELAGYGLSAIDRSGALGFVVEVVTQVEGAHVVVTGNGRSGACVGDSGGPMLGRIHDGSVRVLGVLDAGDATCVGEDRYTRVDLLPGWEPFDRLVAEAEEPAGCRDLSASGECLWRQAIWCEAGQLRAEDCESRGLVCGWSGNAAGFRCVAIEADPCKGVGSFRTCDGNDVVTCVDGALSRVECEPCGTECIPWASAAGAQCMGGRVR